MPRPSCGRARRAWGAEPPAAPGSHGARERSGHRSGHRSHDDGTAPGGPSTGARIDGRSSGGHHDPLLRPAGAARRRRRIRGVRARPGLPRRARRVRRPGLVHHPSRVRLPARLVHARDARARPPRSRTTPDRRPDGARARPVHVPVRVRRAADDLSGGRRAPPGQRLPAARRRDRHRAAVVGRPARTGILEPTVHAPIADARPAAAEGG